MLHKKYRLTKRKDFAYMYRKGEPTHTRYLTLVVTPTKQPIKIGFSVSKKIGKAHTRNLIKRRLTEVVRDMLPSIDTHHNYIIVAKTGVDTITFNQLKAEAHTLFTKSGYYE